MCENLMLTFKEN